MNIQYTTKLIRLAKEIDNLIKHQDYEGVKFRISYLVGYILSLEEVPFSKTTTTDRELNKELQEFGIPTRTVNALRKFRIWDREYEKGYYYKPIYTLYELLNEVQENGWDRIKDTKNIGENSLTMLKELVLSDKPATSDNLSQLNKEIE